MAKNEGEKKMNPNKAHLEKGDFTRIAERMRETLNHGPKACQ
jgi:hypothetical protein